MDFSIRVIYRIRLNIKTRLWLWKPFFGAKSQFTVNNVWSFRNTDTVTSHFLPFQRSATSNINYTVYWDMAQQNSFHYRILVFYAEFIFGGAILFQWLY